MRARVAARCDDARDARRIGEEVETLYTNGPAGGGGATKAMREVVAVASAFVPREAVRTSVEWMEEPLMRTLRELAHSRTGRQGRHVEHLAHRVRVGGLSAARAVRDRGAREASTSPGSCAAT